MSWKDRAVKQGPGARPKWMDRASRVEEPESDSLSGVLESGQAALESFGDAALLGYLPQVQAVASKLVPNPNRELDAALEAQGFTVENADPSYVDRRDQNIARQERLSRENPVSSAIGTGLGIGATALVPARAAASGASLAEKSYRGAKAGAKLGFLANPGDTEGEMGLQLDDRIKNAAMGGAVGGAAPVALSGLAKGAGAVGRYARDKGALKATRALGRPKPTQAAKMSRSGQDLELGRELLDEKAIPLLGTPKRIATRVTKLKEKAGKEIGELIDSAGDSKVVDAEEIADRILKSDEFNEMMNIPGMEATVSAIRKQAATLAKNGKLTVKQAQKLRQGIDRSINFNKAAPDMRGAQEGLYQQRTAIRDAMDEGIGRLSDSAPKGALKAANRRFGNLTAADDILEQEIARNQANRSVSLTDTISGGSGAVIGGMLGGPAGATAGAVTGAALNKFGRSFGNSLQARGFNRAGKALEGVARVADAVPAGSAAVGAARSATITPDMERKEDPILQDKRLLGVFQKDPSLVDLIQDKERRKRVKKYLKENASSKKPEGRSPSADTRWARSGAKKLGLSSKARERAMKTKRGRNLLIDASNLKPDSKRMKELKNRIEKDFGGNN